MAEAKISREEFQCPVCLDLLRDPVTISCGHSYCRNCIRRHWDQQVQSDFYTCPQCRKRFRTRPAVARNTILAEMVEKLRKIPPSADCHAEAGDVPCDVCTEQKYKAVKSCVECQESYCHAHLERYEEFHLRKRHRMIEATDRLQEMFCSKHQKLLEVFCRTDQQCVCVLCVMDEHKDHDTVSAAAQWAETQKQLTETQAVFEQKIQQREEDLQKLRDSVETHKRSALQAVEDTEKITEMVQSIQRRCHVVNQKIREHEDTLVNEANGIVEKLQQEIDSLKGKRDEMVKLSQAQDHISFIQSFPALSAPPESTVVPFTSFSSIENVAQSFHQLRNKLEELCNTEMIQGTVTEDNIDLWSRRIFLCYSRQFTPDPNTMHKLLRLSGNTVSHANTDHSFPDHPDRFDYTQILCEESVSGRCYWELEWTGYTLFVAVAYKSINRKGRIAESLFGYNDQSWCLICSVPEFSFMHDNLVTRLSRFDFKRIGVFVDHEAGTLSFYGVSDTMTLIHRVQTTFTRPLCPGFYLYPHTTVRMCAVSQ